ncbi:MAG: UvrD-helicase domain-containing protein [Candidatus Vogelbacteria bacterium]|nr:UvrD-helicase domain-containing protein [Candidatus Vogelbacteria bacterium]
MGHLDGLNERQREAASHISGPLLVVAGAGAGKTTTIAHRIANLIQSGINPENILAVTFTNKAAKEMRERVERLLETAKVPLVTTFHSLGVLIIKENANTLGVTRFFSILDKDESLSVIKKCAKELGFGPKDYNASAVQAVISKEKNRLKNLEEFEVKSGDHYFGEMVHSIWEKYEKLLKVEGAFDFDDLIRVPVLLLRQNEAVRSRYQNLWQYIHIDEYQDTNTAQYEFSRLLAEAHRNICVVGDSDQAIYGWRQADFRNILNFEKNFPGTKTVLLEENYRSTKNILKAANSIIRKNKNRREKTLFTNGSEGAKIDIYEATNEGDEARYVVEKTKEIIADGNTNPEDIAVLYRANFQSRILEEHLLRANVPYQLVGIRFYERKEIKDIIAFMKCALNPEDMQSFERIINVPPRGIGETSFKKIAEGREYELPDKIRVRIEDFRTTLKNINGTLLREKLSSSIKYIVKASGLEKYLKGEGDSPYAKTPEDKEDRLENLRELVTLASKYDFLEPALAVEKFLTETSLLSDQDSLAEKQSGIKLMTVHASKGLEFKYVFVIGLEEDLFPHKRMGSDETVDTEEERRLFYVAITRAKEKVFLSYAQMRTIFGQRKMNLPSTFLADLPEDIVAMETNGIFKSTYGRAGKTNFLGSDDDNEDILKWDCLK